MVGFGLLVAITLGVGVLTTPTVEGEVRREHGLSEQAIVHRIGQDLRETSVQRMKVGRSMFLLCEPSKPPAYLRGSDRTERQRAELCTDLVQ